MRKFFRTNEILVWNDKKQKSEYQKLTSIQKIKGTFETHTIQELEKGMNCLIIKGANAGKIGKIDEIKEGTFSIPKSIDITLDDRQIEIPARLVMPIGKDEPGIKIR